MSIQIKSFNQILGEMIRKVVADTPLNDVNVGSALLTLLEAAAQVDFENNASILNILELLSIDAIRSNDLDSRAADFGLSRIPARKSSGLISIGDSSISKRSTGLYQVKLAPIAGSNQIFVNNAANWAATGNLFIGRGTQNFEGPISYTSIVDNGTFFTINLGSALQKDHLISDVVVDSQGTVDRIITAGTSVNIPANSQNPAIEFFTLRDAVIPSGEDSVSGVDIVAVVAGSRGNAGINTITAFVSPPFAGATVTNPTALTNGRDVESDDDLRERLKSYSGTLARGTADAILSSIIGISDPDDSKQVASAVVTEPPEQGDPSIIYIDDGSGFQPSFAGQSVDRMLASASGNEEFLQLANYPLPRPQVINAVEGPFTLVDGMTFSVLVDGIEEAITFSSSQFLNIAAARLSEIIIAINDQSELFKATFTDNSDYMLIYPTAHDAETIQVAALKGTDDPLLYSNSQFKFPTNEYSYIRLYQNNTLLNEKERSASLLTTSFGSWNITTSGNIIIAVDETPPQDRGFDVTDFGGSPFITLTLEDWATAFNRKFAGLTATATSSGRLQIVSNREGSTSKVEVFGGTYFDKWFSNQDVVAVGQNSDFELNRQTGNLRILRDISPGDTITAGAEDTKGNIVSSTTITGNYNVSTDANGRPAELVIVSDSDEVIPRTEVVVSEGSTLNISNMGGNVMRIMSSSITAFAAAQPNDFIYIATRSSGSWVNPANCGLFKIVSKGEHTSAGVDSYVEVNNVGIVAGSHTVVDRTDVQVFKADTYPQIWKGSYTSVPATASIQEIVDSINDNTVNVKASIFKTNAIKVTSTTEEDGSIALPISTGRATSLFPTAGEEQSGNPSHKANRTLSKDAMSFFKRTEPTDENAGGVSGRVVWLDRMTYGDIGGQLTSDAVPGVEGVDTYSEELQSTSNLSSNNVSYDDAFNTLSGANKKHYRSIRDKLSGDRIGTQFELPTTVMDYPSGEKFNIMRPMGISSEDSVVLIIDQDAVNKTINIPMSRTGRINSLFPATGYSFSADDADNEPGITFSNLQVWGKTANKTEFENYAVWMRARNWYVSGGATSGGGSMILRSKEYGPHGENLRFKIEYPTFPNADSIITHENSPDYTLSTYFFGSGLLKNIGLVSSALIAVSDLGSDIFRYQLPVTVDLSTVVVGDVVSILSDSGVSAQNRGQFRIRAVDQIGKTIDVHNPNGTATGVGTQEQTTITTIADVLGSKTVSVVTDILPSIGLDGKWFKINDTAGSVAVYYNVGTPNPGAVTLGVNRVIEIGPLTGAEADTTVTALTAGVIAADPEFDATYSGTDLTITNSKDGALAIASDGTTATLFSFAGTPGTAPVSVDGKYFILQHHDGSCAYWYDVTGLTPEPLHGADESVRISTVNAGDSANTIATKTAPFISDNGAFATVLSNVITAVDYYLEARPASSAGTSGFTVVELVPGATSIWEQIQIASSFMIFPLTETSVASIVDKINESTVIEATGVDTLNPIVFATRDEEYTPAGANDYSVSLAYGHNPDTSSGLSDYISFYDGINWVKDFENTSPNFVLKKSMTLQDVAPTAYDIETAPNLDIADLGEYFKLVPVTLNNVYHHFTQKALSQLPIVADIDISNDKRRIQVKSKLLGSEGAVEVVGGNANNISLSIFGEAQVTPGSTKDFLEVKTAAYPVTLTKGDVVKVENTQSAKRFSRLSSLDSIDVAKISSDNVEYRWNSKTTNMNQFVRFTTTDASAFHGRPAGTIWRWTHNDGGSVFEITADTNGLPAEGPNDEVEAGGADAPNLQIILVQSGSVSTPIKFQLTVSGVPTLGDYFTFSTASGVKFAVWFDVNGFDIPPTGASYLAADYKIEVDINPAFTEDEIVSAMALKLLANSDFLTHFSGFQSEGATFEDVEVGDLLNVYGAFDIGWSSGNKSKATGDGNISGLPIVNVNYASRYIDVVNFSGVAMTSQPIGYTGFVNVVPTPIIEWKLNHSAKSEVVQVVLNSPGGIGAGAVVTTLKEHGLAEGDTFVLEDNGLAQTEVVGTVIDSNNFSFINSLDKIAGNYFNGSVIKSSASVTRYKIESIGFNDLYRLSFVDGDAPGFIDAGAAVDDILMLSSNTFKSSNSGRFKILGLDNSSVIFENSEAVEELNTIVEFNNLDTSVVWVSNSDEVTGAAGSFKNVNVGDWVKKSEDDDSLYIQVIGMLDDSEADASYSTEDAVKLILGDLYQGSSSTSNGVSFDQKDDVNKGIYIKDTSDVTVLDGDSIMSGDTLFVDKIANDSWFSTPNSGSFSVIQYGTGSDGRPFARIKNAAGLTESNRLMSVSEQGFFLIEGEDSKYSSIRVVEHTSIDSFNEDRRIVYMTPATKVDKMSQSSGTKITAMGKLGYSNDVTTGIDGYTYYTGLMRTVQRIIDGFEPDQSTYPGRRAVGGFIELLPPLIKRVKISLEVTTNEGVNLNEISNDIKSAIIDYIDSLGVGQDVILSEIIVKVMSITGVAAVTFNVPAASTERISVADNEKAFVEPQDISVA